MKHAIINFFMLCGVILFAALVAFMTPLATVEQEVKPPVKTDKHLYLEKKEFLTRSEMDELQEEILLYEKLWDKKAADEALTPTEGLGLVQERMQILLAVVLTIFLLFRRFGSYKDSVSALIALLTLTFAVPILSVGTTLYGVVLVIVVSYSKLFKQHNNFFR